ncbi:MAG: integrase core domain-containing protein [Pseudonocardiaceae bacterium]
MASHSGRLSLGPFTAKSMPATAGVEKLYPFTVSNLSLSSSGSLPWCSPAHLPTSAPFRARPPGRHPAGYPGATAWSSGILAPGSRRLSAAGIRLLGIQSRRGIAPLSRSAYRALDQPGPRRGFHVPRRRDTTGVGAPLTPRPAVFPRPTLTARSPLAASSNGQALSPWSSSRRPGLEITRHQQGFTSVHPSGLPLARCSPGRNGGPSAFSLGFAPPRTGSADARQSGDRSRTLIENYAPGITGLQPASSLAIRDLVSHVRSFLSRVKTPAAPPPAGRMHPYAVWPSFRHCARAFGPCSAGPWPKAVRSSRGTQQAPTAHQRRAGAHRAPVGSLVPGRWPPRSSAWVKNRRVLPDPVFRRANAICERMIGTLRRELLDRILIVNERHLRRILSTYLHHFNTARPHRTLGQLAPVQAETHPPRVINLVDHKVRRRPILDGLTSEYQPAAYPTERTKHAGQAHHSIFEPHTWPPVARM